MDFEKKLKLFFVLFLVWVASTATFLFVHEATHLLLADKATGVCFGVCDNGSAPIAFGLAYGKHNDLSRREDIPSATGLVAAIVFCLAGCKAAIDLAFSEKQN